MRIKQHRNIFWIIIICAAVLVLFAAQIWMNKNRTAETVQQGDRAEMFETDLLFFATHVSDARYIKRNGLCYQFQITNSLKGDLREGQLAEIDISTFPSDIELLEGEEYFLPLYKVMTVYADYEGFQLCGNTLIKNGDPDWMDIHNTAKKMILEGKDFQKPYVGAPFTRSKDIEEIVEFADAVYLLRIEHMIYKENSDDVETAAYQCSISAVLKEVDPYKGPVYVSFFENMVKEGEEYIVCLMHPDELSAVFPLASRSNSVIPRDEAEKTDSLSSLLRNAVFSTGEFETISCWDLQLSEWEAAGIDYDEYWYSDPESDFRMFFNGNIYHFEGKDRKVSLLLESAGTDYGTSRLTESSVWIIESGSIPVRITLKENLLTVSLKDEIIAVLEKE